MYMQGSLCVYMPANTHFVMVRHASPFVHLREVDVGVPNGVTDGMCKGRIQTHSGPGD